MPQSSRGRSPASADRARSPKPLAQDPLAQGSPAPGARPPGRTRPPGGQAPADRSLGRQALGRWGEDLAVRRLTEAGIVVLERNWRCRAGEIDIVARDGDALVVCEVKTRRAGPFEHPLAAVTPKKTERLRLLAERWLEPRGGPPPGGVRIDVVAVTLPDRGAPVVEHVRGVE